MLMMMDDSGTNAPCHLCGASRSSVSCTLSTSHVSTIVCITPLCKVVMGGEVLSSAFA